MFKCLGVMEELQPASSTQVGGSHYSKYAIQPSEYIYRNGLDWLRGNAIKYITRCEDKNGVEDIDKAIHYLQLYKEWGTWQSTSVK